MPNTDHFPDRLEVEALAIWMSLSGVTPPSGQEACSQKVWDDGISLAISSRLLLQAGAADRARLLASLSPSSGSWLHALPCVNLGLRLGNGELRIALGLRLPCRRSAGRHKRLALANEVILRSIR